MKQNDNSLNCNAHPSLKPMAEKILAAAKQHGATDAAVSIASEDGFSVGVRMGAVEKVEHHRDKMLAIAVYFDKQKASVSTSDFSDANIEAMVKKACEIAKHTQEDPFAGLADAKLMAKNIDDLDLYHPWHVTPEVAIQKALDCEKIARGVDKRIVNCEGVDVNTHQSFSVLANSRGFIAEVPTTRHSITCSLIAEQAGKMERDYDYSVARDASDLKSFSALANQAAEKTLACLGARKIHTCKVPVIFSARIARGLLSNFSAAINGHSLYKKTSFLLDQLGQTVFAKHINVDERPHLTKALGSAYFDADGVATTDKFFVKDGVLQTYALDAYAARKLKMTSTANAGGVYNLFISHSEKDLKALLKQMDKGVLVTSLMGQGVNMVTGDYSRGASGFWVEHGEIQFPVSEITIAGNLKDMFLNLVNVGNDLELNGAIRTGSILIEEMTVAGE